LRTWGGVRSAVLEIVGAMNTEKPGEKMVEGVAEDREVSVGEE
jgi:hypothetical protein